MKYPAAQIVHTFYAPSLLRRLILVLAALGLITASAFIIPKVKAKLTLAPVYKTSEKVEYVNIHRIESNIAGDNITIIQPSDKALLPQAKWVPQTFNNCVPATTSMLLQYFGYQVGQNEIKTHLRTNSDDKNVFTFEIRDYLKDRYNISSKLFYNGDLQTLKLLLANGFYIVVEDWLHPNEDIGHVTIIRGFDDNQGVLIADDSYMGVNIIYKYEEFDHAQWKPFNREYLPIFTADKEPLLKAILGDNWDEEKMYQSSLKRNLVDTQKNPHDLYAWFNLGTSYFALKQYEKAQSSFETSKSLGWPKRMLWYQIQPIQTLNALGDYQKALELIQIGLWGNDSFAELHFEAAYAYKGLGDLQKAREEAQKALFYSANFSPAKELLSSL